MTYDREHPAAGSVRPARTDKAGCGIRFAADELQAGIDFSDARALCPRDNQTDGSDESTVAAGEHRPDQGDPQSP